MCTHLATFHIRFNTTFLWVVPPSVHTLYTLLHGAVWFATPLQVVNILSLFSGKSIPWGSMYGIFTYIWLIFMGNVGKYTIHGSYGIDCRSFIPARFFQLRLLANLKTSPFRLSPDLVTLSGAISACAKGIIWQMATSLLRDLEATSFFSASAARSFASSQLQVTGLVSRATGMKVLGWVCIHAWC